MFANPGTRPFIRSSDIDEQNTIPRSSMRVLWGECLRPVLSKNVVPLSSNCPASRQQCDACNDDTPPRQAQRGSLCLINWIWPRHSQLSGAELVNLGIAISEAGLDSILTQFFSDLLMFPGMFSSQKPTTFGVMFR